MYKIFLTREMLAKSRVIAKGLGIRDVDRLVEEHGGKAPRWVKKSSPRVRIGDDIYELHWYEHPGLGRYELKIKHIGRA